MYRTSILKTGLMSSGTLMLLTCTYRLDDPLVLKSNSENKTLLRFIMRKQPQMSHMIFRPSYLISNSHFSSIYTGLASRFNEYTDNKHRYSRQIFTLSDGEQIALDYSNNDVPDDAPLIVIVPGLLSSVYDQYIKSFLNVAEKNGYRWVLINYRGV